MNVYFLCECDGGFFFIVCRERNVGVGGGGGGGGYPQGSIQGDDQVVYTSGTLHESCISI